MNRPRGFTLLAVVPLLLVVAGAIESPQYTVVHSESDFEVRLYRESVWMSAPTDEISFEKATKFGFHRLFQYIQGANLNSSRIRMTAPVLTSIVPGAGPLHSSAYFVRFYVPVKFQASPPVPLPELNLHSDRWGSHCIAVRQFSGFARDSNVIKEAEKLAISLSQSSWANLTEFSDKNAYSIAQYNSPFHFIGRVNEVWVDVGGSEVPGCESSHAYTY
uniref:SOUL heme-binding family protein n=1 Tax=Musa acuminata subsp. malaccensis TaxID=214687 RepID=A0A804JVS8_MUSAM|nr:PREDICTED: heme-binding protein 2-like [Musa acuminata subsp. malaccensis]